MLRDTQLDALMPCLLIKPSPVQHFILQHQTIALTPQRPHLSIDPCHFLFRGSLACFQLLQWRIQVLVFGLLPFKMIIGSWRRGLFAFWLGSLDRSGGITSAFHSSNHWTRGILCYLQHVSHMRELRMREEPLSITWEFLKSIEWFED